MARSTRHGRRYALIVRLVVGAVIVVPGLVAIGIILNGNYW